MDYFLVQKAKDTANKQGLPNDWPVKANPCKKEDKVPEGMEILTQIELEALKASNLSEYESWKLKEDKKEEKRRKDEKEAKESIPKSAQEKLKVLQFSNDEIKEIMGSNYVG